MEDTRSDRFHKELLFTVPFSSLQRHAMKITSVLDLGAIVYSRNVEI